MKNKYEVVLCDIDRTLVDRNYKITQETINTINDLHKHGYKFGLASGRPVRVLIEMFIKKWNLDFMPEIIIGMNGCQVYDTMINKTYEFDFIDKNDAKLIINSMYKNKRFPFTYRKRYTVYYELDDDTEATIYSQKRTHYKVKHLSQLWKYDVPVILCRSKIEDNPETFEIASSICPSKCKCVITKDTMVEFVNKNVSKGSALQQYCNITNLDIKRVVSFGDTTNDNELLKFSGLGVCMLNGTDDTKKCADVITDYDVDHNGFSDFVYKNLIIDSNNY